jgi:hypothetical protein
MSPECKKRLGFTSFEKAIHLIDSRATFSRMLVIVDFFRNNKQMLDFFILPRFCLFLPEYRGNPDRTGTEFSAAG